MVRNDLARSFLIAGFLLVAVSVAVGVESTEPRIGTIPDSRILAMVPNGIVKDLDSSAIRIHDYGEVSLVRTESRLPARVAAHTHQLPDTHVVGFRSWKGTLPPASDSLTATQGTHILALIGPLDRGWRLELEACGVDILAPAKPFALVVDAGATEIDCAFEIETSAGFPIVRGIGLLPIEARIHRSLLQDLRGDGSSSELEVRVSGYAGRSLPAETKRAVGDDNVMRFRAEEMSRWLVDHPEIAYVEPVFEIQLHNNIAARLNMVAVEPVWDTGYSGEGVIIAHNDSGVDLNHPDLAGAVRATAGRMEYADTAHGTHTAGSIIGRGTLPAPVNSSGCGDLTGGLPSVRGMAWGAEIVTNNIFEEGYDRVTEMMAWGVRQGAEISSNSWGLVGLTGPEVSYSAAAVEADAAVRDADPDAPGPQPLAIFISAGNTGPQPGTVTSPGTAKNVITIGAAQNDRCGAWVPDHQDGPDPRAVLTESGRGPSQGRLKPDLAAPGSDVLSSESADPYAVQPWDESWTGAEYATNTGTSQAVALAAGAGAVLHEFLWRNRGRRPSPALLKAALINAARDRRDGTDFDRGWGHLDLAASIGGSGIGSVTFLDQDEVYELVTGAQWGAPIVVRSSALPLELSLVWTDVPGEEDALHPLVNDLDVVMTSPDGSVYRGNMLSAGGGWSEPDPGILRDSAHNTEVIRVESPAPGTWIVKVVGVDVPEAPTGLSGQDFALVYSGHAGPCMDPPLPPTIVEAQPLGDNQIRLDWSAVSGVSRYEVSRSENPGGQPYVPVATVPVGVTSFVDTEVSGGLEYHYVVRAERGCWSEYSLEASATTTGECRSVLVFAGLVSVDDAAKTGCSLELTWEPAESRCPGLAMYTIYRGTHEGFDIGPENILVDSIFGTRWLDQRLESGRDYYYAVRAWHHDQAFDDDNTVELGGRPSGPDDVYLHEDAEGGSDGWILEPGSSVDSGSDPWRLTDDDAWEGEQSWFVADEDRVKDQVLRSAEPISLPAGSSPILEFAHRYRLHNGRDGGRLEYSTDGGRVWHDILEGDGQTVPDDRERWQSVGYTGTIGAPSNPLFRAEGWTGDSRGWVHSRADLTDFAGLHLMLRWRVGCDETPGDGWGWWLDEIRLVIENECLPCLVSSPAEGPTARATDDGVAIEWVTHSTEERYRVSRGIGPDGPFEELAVVTAPATGYHDTSASGGTPYTYVYSVGAAQCWTDNSQGVTVTAGGPCKLAPVFWGLDEVIDRREPGCALDLEWRPGAPGCAGAGVSYRVYRSSTVDPGPGTLIAENLAGPRFRDHSIADSADYNYRVRAVDGVSLAEDANPVIHSGWTTGPQEVHFSDSVEGSLDGWWTGLGSDQDTGTQPWVVVDDNARSGGRSWFCRNEPQVKDQVVGLVEGFEIIDGSTVLGFHHLYDLEPFWDGGRLEYSTDGGSSWQDILRGDGATVGDNPARFLRGAYTGFVSVGTGHPFGGEKAWTGFYDGWIESVVDLAEFVGLTVQFRWRLGCDRSDARVGWWLDDVEIRTTTTCETVELPPPRTSQGRRP